MKYIVYANKQLLNTNLTKVDEKTVQELQLYKNTKQMQDRCTILT